MASVSITGTAWSYYASGNSVEVKKEVNYVTI